MLFRCCDMFKMFTFILLNFLVVSIRNNVASHDGHITSETVPVLSGNYSNNLNLSISEVHNWFPSQVKHGSISGVAIDKHGNLHVFHRDNRIWNQHTFNLYNVYAQQYLGPISNPTVFVIGAKDGTVFHQWGSARFYMPHGITVDHDDNVWLTDVALHQIFKFSPLPKDKDDPVLTLGSAFQPGRNRTAFCKPTSVAVLKSGSFFVADGYCNSRIVKYASDGTFLTEFGRSSYGILKPYYFNIPHGLTLANDKNLLCVADRENGRIQCFDAHNGTFAYDIRPPKIGSTIYDVAYSPVNDGLFYVVNGISVNERVYGFIISAISRQVIAEFHPAKTNFTSPHCIAVSENGSIVYVGELEPHELWKFHVDGLPKQLTSEVKIHAEPTSALKSSLLDIINVKSVVAQEHAGTVLMTILISASVLLFALILLFTSFVYSRMKRRQRVGNSGSKSRSAKKSWLTRKSSSVSGGTGGVGSGGGKSKGFEVSDLLLLRSKKQRGDGFMKLRTTNYEESEDDDNGQRDIDNDEDDDNEEEMPPLI